MCSHKALYIHIYVTIIHPKHDETWWLSNITCVNQELNIDCWWMFKNFLLILLASPFLEEAQTKQSISMNSPKKWLHKDDYSIKTPLRLYSEQWGKIHKNSVDIWRKKEELETGSENPEERNNMTCGWREDILDMRTTGSKASMGEEPGSIGTRKPWLEVGWHIKRQKSSPVSVLGILSSQY